MEAFRGTVPLVPCRELSGADCDLVVSADDAACPAGHAVPTRDLPDDDLPVSGRYRPRARLAGHEDFEEVSYEDVVQPPRQTEDLRVLAELEGGKVKPLFPRIG